MADLSQSFADALEIALADPTVLFEKPGKTGLGHGRRDQSRRVSLVRVGGSVRFSSAKEQRFLREESWRVVVAAQSEQAVDLLFAQLLHAVFAISGPDAFRNDSPYAWGGQDSQGGAHVVRQPIIEMDLTLRFKVPTPDELKAELESAQATLTELGEDETVETP